MESIRFELVYSFVRMIMMWKEKKRSIVIEIQSRKVGFNKTLSKLF